MTEQTMRERAIEKAARSDAEFDGRPFDGLGRADRERYLARAGKAYDAILSVLAEPDDGMVHGAISETRGLFRSIAGVHDPRVIETLLRPAFTAAINKAREAK